MKKRKPLQRKPLLKIHKKTPVLEHLYELRKRFFYVFLVFVAGSIIVYFFQEHIVNYLLRPSNNQQFIYTNPGGGIAFLFQICFYGGALIAIPFIIYEIIEFLSPLIDRNTKSLVFKYAFLSAILALIGFVFGYYIGLPAALKFLGNQFQTKQIHPLFTIQEYFNFILVYLLGMALLFQIPIIINIIDKIKPIKPRSLIKLEKYVIGFSFIISMIMVPTINVINQLIIALPIIFMYQLSILFIWRKHYKRTRPSWVMDLVEKDRIIQSQRLDSNNINTTIEQ